MLKNLFKLARYHGVVASDETTGLRLKTSHPRDRVWSEEEIARWAPIVRSSIARPE